LETDLFYYLRAILRWSWVTVILVAACAAAIVYTNANVPLEYESTVKLEVAAPEPDEVTLFSTVRTGATRDEISAVQADFAGIVRGAITAKMTIDTLGLNMSVQDFQDKVYAEIPPLSDYVYVHARADNPQDAATIARVHTENSLKYFGESRAKTTTVRRDFIVQQLQIAAADLTAARDALLRFQTKNGTADLARDIQQLQDTLRSLRLDRDRDAVEIERATAAANYFAAQAQKATADNDTAAASSYRSLAAANQATVEGMRSAVTRLNELIAQRENELLSLVSLSAEYDRIQTDLQRATNNYNFLQSKLNEAQIKENDARTAGFIQIIEPAQVPTRPQQVSTRSMLIPGVAASLVAGVILSFILEYIFFTARRKRGRTGSTTA